MSLKVISFKICPFVQRSIITLNHTGYDYAVEYIDLANPPAWFKEISPLGKVPVVVVDDKEVIFESAVINEYVNEITEAQLLPSDPLAKAQQRAWIEYTSNLISKQFQTLAAQDESGFNEKSDELIQGIMRLADVVEGPFAYGEKLSLLDTTIAPIFMRINLVDRLREKFTKACEDNPKIKAWSDQLLALPEVQNSVPEDFKERFTLFFKNKESYALS